MWGGLCASAPHGVPIAYRHLPVSLAPSLTLHCVHSTDPLPRHARHVADPLSTREAAPYSSDCTPVPASPARPPPAAPAASEGDGLVAHTHGDVSCVRRHVCRMLLSSRPRWDAARGGGVRLITSTKNARAFGLAFVSVHTFTSSSASLTSSAALSPVSRAACKHGFTAGWVASPAQNRRPQGAASAARSPTCAPSEGCE